MFSGPCMMFPEHSIEIQRKNFSNLARNSFAFPEFSRDQIADIAADIQEATTTSTTTEQPIPTIILSTIKKEKSTTTEDIATSQTEVVSEDATTSKLSTALLAADQLQSPTEKGSSRDKQGFNAQLTVDWQRKSVISLRASSVDVVAPKGWIAALVILVCAVPIALFAFGMYFRQVHVPQLVYIVHVHILVHVRVHNLIWYTNMYSTCKFIWVTSMFQLKSRQPPKQDEEIPASTEKAATAEETPQLTEEEKAAARARELSREAHQEARLLSNKGETQSERDRRRVGKKPLRKTQSAREKARGPGYFDHSTRYGKSDARSDDEVPQETITEHQSAEIRAEMSGVDTDQEPNVSADESQHVSFEIESESEERGLNSTVAAMGQSSEAKGQNSIDRSRTNGTDNQQKSTKRRRKSLEKRQNFQKRSQGSTERGHNSTDSEQEDAKQTVRRKKGHKKRQNSKTRTQNSSQEDA